MARQKPGPKERPVGEKTKTASVSLVPEDWMFLKALALEVQAKQSSDPGMGRSNASAAIRWLIEQERRKPSRQKGTDDEVYFYAGPGQERVLCRSTASTGTIVAGVGRAAGRATVHGVSATEKAESVEPKPKKKAARKPSGARNPARKGRR